MLSPFATLLVSRRARVQEPKPDRFRARVFCCRAASSLGRGKRRVLVVGQTVKAPLPHHTQGRALPPSSLPPPPATTVCLESKSTTPVLIYLSHPLFTSSAFPLLQLSTPTWQLREAQSPRVRGPVGEEPRAPLLRAKQCPGCTPLPSLKPYSWG